MNKDVFLTKIVKRQYDYKKSTFIQTYDKIFNWIVDRNKSITLSVSIYSFDFLLYWNTDVKILDPYLYNDKCVVHVNESILPRYGFTLMQWLKDLHNTTDILANYFINDINKMIISYML